MKRLLIYFLFLPAFIFPQGSGKALNFDGTNDYVSAGAIGTANTIEFWVNSTNAINGTAAATPILSLNGPVSDKYIWINDAFGLVSGETITIAYGNGAGQKSYITTVLQTGWNHVAIVSNGTIYDKVYINGVSVTVSQSSGNALVAAISSLQIGGRTDNGSGAAAYYKGELDELRFWSTQRSQTEIRDNMCKKLIGNETGLIGYYNFDNGSGTSLSDLQTNGTVHDGTATNFAMTGAASNWVTSSAPIGNASAYLYPGSWAGQVLALPSTANGTVKVSSVTGSPAPVGMQLYRVDVAPNSSTGISGRATNSVYWGGFIIGSASYSYTGVYDYTNFNYIPSANEGSLKVFYRANNAVNSWTNSGANLNTTTNTLTQLSIPISAEFILGNAVTPLPIELIDFKVDCGDEVPLINWTTASEYNNDFFTLERSSSDMNWKPIKIIKGAGNSNQALSYTFIDSTKIITNNYYRLKQTDYDGVFKYSNIIYSPCNKNLPTEIIVSPNPNNGQFKISNIEPNSTLEIINSLGKKVFITKADENQLTFNIPELKDGTYTLRSINTQGIKNFKLLITK
ncbi:MAG: LamG-like jellyroll fold domain-containing protein [Bacteroidia bacterium]